MNKFPFDPGIKGSYFKLYREYNKARTFKKRTFKQNILHQLDELRSPPIQKLIGTLLIL